MLMPLLSTGCKNPLTRFQANGDLFFIYFFKRGRGRLVVTQVIVCTDPRAWSACVLRVKGQLTSLSWQLHGGGKKNKEVMWEVESTNQSPAADNRWRSLANHTLCSWASRKWRWSAATRVGLFLSFLPDSLFNFIVFQLILMLRFFNLVLSTTEHESSRRAFNCAEG